MNVYCTEMGLKTPSAADLEFANATSQAAWTIEAPDQLNRKASLRVKSSLALSSGEVYK